MNQENMPGRRSLVLNIIGALLVVVLLNACSDETATLDKNSQPKLSNTELLSIGKAFAKVLQEPTTRQFIKDQALLQFDKDYDILVQMILDKEVTNGKTFGQLIENASEDDVKSYLKKYPLLTIYVPSLKAFSAETWDTEKDVPKIAIDILRDISNRIPVLDFDGDISMASSTEQPTYPVVVLKENERVGLRGKSKINSASRSSVYGNSNFSYYFLDEQMSDENPNARLVSNHTIDQKVVDAYNKSKNCATCLHRDYIYYNISPTEGVTEGPFASNYSEAITAISFNNSAAAQTASDNWTEGNLELHFVITFTTTSGITQLEKVHSMARSVFDDGSGSYTKEYIPSSPITIAPWRMDLYGDRWKVTAFEYDPAGTTSTTTSVSSTIGSNFKVDLSKIGIGFGSSSTTTFSFSATVTSTTGSEALGEGILNWTDQVLTSYGKVPLSQVYVGFTKTLNTGSLYISIEPVRTF
jgi:hypothetical protein